MAGFLLSSSAMSGKPALMKTIAIAALLAGGLFRAHAAECDRFAVSVATDPVPYQYPIGLEKASGLLAKVPDRADIVLIGDSLAANWPADMLRRQFRSEHVWNFAVGGSVSQNTLWQLGRLGTSRLRPERVIVIVGTNNLTREDMPACAISAGIEAVALKAHATWPGARIDLMGIPPRGTDFRFRDEVRAEVNRALDDWASAEAYQHYFEVDAETITCGRHGRASPAAGLSACANYADDFGHFKRAGYDVVFSALSASPD